MEEDRYLVVKSNTLIQENRYELDVQEQKILLYLISKIRPGEEDFDEYEFDSKDLCRLCGIPLNGQNYKNLRESLASLRDKSFWVKDGTRLIYASWIDEPSIDLCTGQVYVKLGATLKPYLLNLRSNFTAYELQHTLKMRSKHSIRMYELMKSYAYLGEVEITLDKLKINMMLNGYEIYNNLKVKVLDVAVREINSCTDLNVTYEPVREARKIKSLKFTIKNKEGGVCDGTV